MKTTINFQDFITAFHEHDRADNFSYAGKRALFDYIEQYEEETGTEWELDIIALCCEYNESTWQEIADDYRIEVEGLDEDEIEEAVRDYVSYHSVIAGEVPGGCVYLAF